MTYRKKLIEVALPLEAINRESAHEKSVPRKGHPATMHLWWARRPLAACRAVLFASIVDDPSSRPEEFPTEEAQQAERERLFRIIEELVKWENSNDQRVLASARLEILRATDGNPPSVLDPFCGGGSIPLEAHRLGLEAHATDLNPVAVLITKALIEIPPKFSGQPPVNPESRAKMGHGGTWGGASGLAEDVRYYGRWMRDEAERRIGYLYPKVRLPAEHGGGEATVIAWLWARTVRCPNPACGAQMPLVRSFWLSSKPKRKVWIEPVVDQDAKTVTFEVRTGEGAPPEPPKTGRGAKFRCLVCQQAADDGHIKSEGKAGRLSTQLMAIVSEGVRRRAYVAASEDQAAAAVLAQSTWQPDQVLADDPRNIWCVNYGLDTFAKLFTQRQLVALTTFSDLVTEARDFALRDALAAGLADEPTALSEGGVGASAYAEALTIYLAFSVDKLADWSSSICSWIHSIEGVRDTFARQAIPMVWDFVEINPLSTSVGNFLNHSEWVADAIRGLPSAGFATASQLDAVASSRGDEAPLVCTDPPYYDNISYADLSDYFYIWLRRTAGSVYSNLFSTLLAPKEQELVATPYRFDGRKEKAEQFFEEGLGDAFTRLRMLQRSDMPLTLFYAFKQAESIEGDGDFAAVLTSTGWETMLTGLLDAGLAVTGTWPMRSERAGRSIAIGTNALASSIVLVCRSRETSAALATRREFASALRAELPDALRKLQQGSIAPVDLAQAAIGPGMAVFSRYARVLEADGTPMRVRTALGLINQVLDEVLTEQESEYDPATRWAVAWFDQFGTAEGAYGFAETLSKAKNISIASLKQDGFLASGAGKVRLLRRDELPPEWDPLAERNLSVWELTQHLIKRLEEQGEAAAAALLRRAPSHGETARDLAYRLYTTCERKKWAQEAIAYNSLVVAWPELTRLAEQPDEGQARML